MTEERVAPYLAFKVTRTVKVSEIVYAVDALDAARRVDLGQGIKRAEVTEGFPAARRAKKHDRRP